MKTHQLIPLVLIILLAGSVVFYVMDFDDHVKVEVSDELDFDIHREVEMALKDALSDVDDALIDVDMAMEEVDEAIEEATETVGDMDVDNTEELDEIMDDLDAELRGIHRELDDILDEVEKEIESEHIDFERKMSKEEIEEVKMRVKSIVKRIISKALDDEPKLEEKP